MTPWGRRNFLRTTTLTYIASGLLILLFRRELSDLLRFPYYSILVLGLVPLGAGLAFFLFNYLRGDFRFSDSTSPRDEYDFPDSYRYDRLEMRVADLSAELASVQKNVPNLKELSQTDREMLLEALKSQLKTVLASDVVRQMEEKYSAKIANDAQVAQVRKGIVDTSLRLRAEIGALSRRANLNLVIGTLTTVVAVALLAYLVLGAAADYTNIPNLLSHFIPRISIAVFIEVFSFFFLKLYKASLHEIKYFQNELTNIEMRAVAVETALLAGHNKTTEPIVDQLIRTERNPSGGGGKLVTEDKDGAPIEPKDVANVLDKLTKLLSVGSHH